MHMPYSIRRPQRALTRLSVNINTSAAGITTPGWFATHCWDDAAGCVIGGDVHLVIVGPVRISSASADNYQANVLATFTVSTLAAYGIMTARLGWKVGHADHHHVHRRRRHHKPGRDARLRLRSRQAGRKHGAAEPSGAKSVYLNSDGTEPGPKRHAAACERDRQPGARQEDFEKQKDVAALPPPEDIPV